ncbi:MAG: crossover junction endodeoxyribonuclease RuvC [Brevinematales bacterium]|nr:crossover junction endodeoxyribonuclease RuvC [Brevinematales bacterium]
MRVIGIDPGLERLGYGVVEGGPSQAKVCGYGLVTTDKEKPVQERLKTLYEDVGVLIERYTPDLLVMEDLIFSRNVTTAMVVSAVRGVVMLLAAQRGLGFREVSPSQLKKIICGNGRATKTQIKRALQYVLGISDIAGTDDVADALALAFVGTLYRTPGV